MWGAKSSACGSWNSSVDNYIIRRRGGGAVVLISCLKIALLLTWSQTPWYWNKMCWTRLEPRAEANVPSLALFCPVAHSAGVWVSLEYHEIPSIWRPVCFNPTSAPAPSLLSPHPAGKAILKGTLTPDLQSLIPPSPTCSSASAISLQSLLRKPRGSPEHGVSSHAETLSSRRSSPSPGLREPTSFQRRSCVSGNSPSVHPSCISYHHSE